MSNSARAVSFARNEWGSWGSDREWSHEELRWADLKDEENFTPGSALPDVKFTVNSGGAAAQQQQQQQDNQLTAGPFKPYASFAFGFQAPPQQQQQQQGMQRLFGVHPSAADQVGVQHTPEDCR
jgi:hypothetical protein